MNKCCNLLIWLILLSVTSGCTGSDRRPECRGPWTPVNVTEERGHG